MIRATKLWCIGCAPGKRGLRRARGSLQTRRSEFHRRNRPQLVRSGGPVTGNVSSCVRAHRHVQPSAWEVLDMDLSDCAKRDSNASLQVDARPAIAGAARGPIVGKLAAGPFAASRSRGGVFVKRPSANFARHSPSCPKGRERLGAALLRQYGVPDDCEYVGTIARQRKDADSPR